MLAMAKKIVCIAIRFGEETMPHDDSAPAAMRSYPAASSPQEARLGRSVELKPLVVKK